MDIVTVGNNMCGRDEIGVYGLSFFNILLLLQLVKYISCFASFLPASGEHYCFLITIYTLVTFNTFPIPTWKVSVYLKKIDYSS